MLGFGLRHQYPIAVSAADTGGKVNEIYGNPHADRLIRQNTRKSKEQAQEQFSRLVDHLKGGDARHI